MIEKEHVETLVQKLSVGLTQTAVDNFKAGMALVEQRTETDDVRLQAHEAAAAAAEATFADAFRTLIALADGLGVPRDRLKSNPFSEEPPAARQKSVSSSSSRRPLVAPQPLDVYCFSIDSR